MHVAIVTMPWQAVTSPSIAVGILSALAQRRGHRVSEIYASLRWAEYLLEQTNGTFTPREYMRLAEDGSYFFGAGDWIFTPALYDTDEHCVAEYRDFLARRNVAVPEAFTLQPLSRQFVRELADDVVAQQPDVLCLTTTFMQNVASLALARRVKQLAPHIPIVFGGGNCDGVQGIALHRAFPFVDYVVRGEGERAFPALLDALETGTEPRDVESLCWRRADATAVVNDAAAAFIRPDEIPMPVYDGYFEQLEASAVQPYVEPKIVLESARGCWWGQKHQCTFCGLNGTAITFRSKSADVFFAEIEQAVERYRCLDILVVDNIMDMRFFKELLPRLAVANWDLRIHYEIKANLSTEQVRMLAAANVFHVQPGIESLSTRVLGIMDKGVTGPHNVQLMRDALESSVSVAWNYLYGFPGETAADYATIVAGLPALYHLQPPVGYARIVLERFSPYFERPELGFARKRPAEFYGYIYQVDDATLGDMVYLFETDTAGISEDEARSLRDALERWKEAFELSSLTYRANGDALIVTDRRVGRPARTYPVRGLDAFVLKRLARNDTATGLTRAAADAGFASDEHDVAAALDRLHADGLIFRDGDRAVALPLSPHDEVLLRAS